MTDFAEYIETTYNLPLSLSDQDALEKISTQAQNTFQKKVERKYKMGAQVLKSVPTLLVEKTIHLLLQQPPSHSLKSFSHLNELLQLKDTGYLDEALFEKYHQKVLTHMQTHKKLLELAHHAEEQSFAPEEFQQYLKSGLFDEGIYTLNRGSSPEEVQAVLDEMRDEIYEKYQLSLCEKDEHFILNNKVRNRHIITQIVVPKYRLAHEILDLLGGDYMDVAIQEQLELGLNEGIPMLKRIKALAAWYSDGYLSQTLVKKCHHSLVQDLDELEAFFRFLEKISELISKDRAIHYMELGLYEVFEEDHFNPLLTAEQHLYDISDYLQESVREYVQIMKTPAASKSLITNRRLAQCFHKFVRSLDELLENYQLLEIKKYLPKLKQFQNGFTQLFEEFHGKNQSLPTAKPYKAIEFIRPYSRMYFNIESENLLRMSMFVVQQSQQAFQQPEQLQIPVLADAAKQFQLRLQVIQEALSNPKELTAMMGQLLPLEQNHLFELNRYLNKEN